MNEENYNKIFRVCKKYSFIELYNKPEETRQYLNYDIFENLLSKHFDYDKKIKILERINESKSLIIDFDKNKALLIKEKIPNWNKVFKSYMSSDLVLECYRKYIAEDIPDFLEPNECIGQILY